MRLFAENPNSVLDEFSQQFEKGYLDTLSRGHGTKRVLANRVYQEYIADKHHIHMNATIWTTLTGFVKYLGKEGKAIVDETEKGWFVQYIDRDPKALARQMQAEERRKAEADDEDRARREIEEKVRAARLRQGNDDEEEKEKEEEKDYSLQQAPTSLSLTLSSQSRKRARTAGMSAVFGNDDEDDDGEEEANAAKRKASSTLALLMKENQSKAPAKPATATTIPAVASTRLASTPDPALSSVSRDDEPVRRSTWLREGIWVKILRGPNEGQKAVVQVLFDDSAELRLDSGETEVMAETSLQTVVPRIGEKAVILRGANAGKEGEVEAIHRDRYCCDLKLTSGQKLTSVDYDDLSKLCEW